MCNQIRQFEFSGNKQKLIKKLLQSKIIKVKLEVLIIFINKSI